MWKNKYYLAWRFEEADEVGGTKGLHVWLDANGRSEEASQGFAPIQYPGRVFWRRRFLVDGSLIFYRITFRGYKCGIRGWAADNQGTRVVIEVVSGWETNPGRLDYGSPTYRRVCDELKPLGFQEVPHDGGLRGEVRIDELEKIETPPPEGPF